MSSPATPTSSTSSSSKDRRPDDMPLREQIEKLIRDDLRAALQAGKPQAEIDAIVTASKAALATAASKLQ